MKNRSVALSLFICAASLVAAAGAEAQVVPGEDHVVEAAVNFWRPTPQLVLSNDAISGVVGNIDFVKEFAIGEKTFPEFHAALGAHHKLRLGYVQMKYDADATITGNFTFNGRTFRVGAPASTDIDWKMWTVGYEWDFVHREMGFFGLVTDLKINQIKASIESSALTSPAATDTNAPVPTIGVIGRGYLAPAISVTGEFTGLKIDRDDFFAKLTDFNIYGTVNFGRNVGAQVGYRSLLVNYDIDADTGDLKMKGPYFGGVVKF